MIQKEVRWKDKDYLFESAYMGLRKEAVERNGEVW
jgi:hypothetical protein